MNRYIRESLMLLLVALPYVYLAYIWSELPERVPTHFDASGKANDWSGRTFLLFVPSGVPAGIYLIMLLVPVLDPKKKIVQMADIYNRLRLVLVLLMAALSIYTLYITKVGYLANSQYLLALLGLMMAILGNYFQALRPNYFLGIRTPWTLENEQVWRKTHFLGGRMWVAGGLLIAILSLILKPISTLLITSGIILGILVIVPVVFSYIEFRRQTPAR